MAVFADDTILDGGIDLLVSSGDVCHLMNAYTNVYATVVSSSIGNFTPSLSAVAGSVNGRSAQLAAEAGVDITADGTLNHYAIVNSGATTVLVVSEADGKVFNNGDTVDIAQAEVYQVRDTVVAP
jgi:hypothetical protein